MGFNSGFKGLTRRNCHVYRYRCETQHVGGQTTKLIRMLLLFRVWQ